MSFYSRRLGSVPLDSSALPVRTTPVVESSTLFHEIPVSANLVTEKRRKSRDANDALGLDTILDTGQDLFLLVYKFGVRRGMKSESHGGAWFTRMSSPPTRRHGPEKENRYTEKPRTALECRRLYAMRELSKTDILSATPGQVTGRWSSCLSPILSEDLHFAVCPRSPQCHGRCQRKSVTKDSQQRQDFPQRFRNTPFRITSCKEKFQANRKFGIPGNLRSLVCTAVTRLSVDLEFVKKRFVRSAREDGLSLASGLLFVTHTHTHTHIYIYFCRSLIRRVQLTMKQRRVTKRYVKIHEHTRNTKLGG